MFTEKDIERFHCKYKIDPQTRCWMWLDSLIVSGYGLFYEGKLGNPPYKQWLAHRFSWALHYGPIPLGMCACHRCDTPACVNPEHLFLGTVGDNNADRHAKGRSSHAMGRPGEKNAHAKLTDAAALYIKYVEGYTQYELAEEFGVNQATISYIRSGRTWKHISIPEE
jgi:hypothetical protein